MKYTEVYNTDYLCFISFKTKHVSQLKFVTFSTYCNMYVYIPVQHLFTLESRAA